MFLGKVKSQGRGVKGKRVKAKRRIRRRVYFVFCVWVRVRFRIEFLFQCSVW